MPINPEIKPKNKYKYPISLCAVDHNQRAIHAGQVTRLFLRWREADFDTLRLKKFVNGLTKNDNKTFKIDDQSDDVKDNKLINKRVKLKKSMFKENLVYWVITLTTKRKNMYRHKTVINTTELTALTKVLTRNSY